MACNIRSRFILKHFALIVSAIATESIRRGPTLPDTSHVSDQRFNDELERLRGLFEQAPGHLCIVCGPEHVFDFANLAYAELIGKPDLTGRRVVDVVPEAMEQGFVALLDQVYRTSKPYAGHRQRLSVASGDGSVRERFVDFVYAPVVDGAGQVSGVFCQGTDVSDSERSDAAVSDSEALFQNMAENAPVVIWVTNSAGKCTYLNARWYELTGQNPEQALGDGRTDATHPDDQDMIRTKLRAADTAREPFRMEYRLRMADGGYRWFIDAANPRYSASGTFLGYIGSGIDIDERHESEQRLRISESRFRAAVAAVHGILWTNNAAGEMVGDQPDWGALTGQSPAEYGGYGWAAAVHPQDEAATVAAWQAAVAAKSVFAHEHRVRRFDGQWRHFSIRAVPIIDDGGEIVEWVGIHTDISEQRAAEAELRALNEELEQLVQREVTQRLAVENSLRQSQKMEALGQLTGGVAHDFNNMLAVIGSAFSLLKRQMPKASPSVAQLLDAGEDATNRATRLTKRLLAFARQQPLSPQHVDVNALIASLSELLVHSLGKNIELDLQLGDEIWPTFVDPNQLENVILNVAMNARDAMNRQGRLTIATRNVVEQARDFSGSVSSTSFILIAISDTGAGMTPDVLARAFEPFFTTKPVGQGTGLGLSQAYGFLKQSGGNLHIASEPDRGTIVKIYLPRAIENATMPSGPAAAANSVV